MIDLANSIIAMGGSCCTKDITKKRNGVFIKKINKSINGVENGYRKFLYEIDHILEANLMGSSLYPRIYKIMDTKHEYSVEMEYCFDGITLADILRDNKSDISYIKRSVKNILKELFDNLYVVRQVKPNKRYIEHNYFDRISRRYISIVEQGLIEKYNFTDGIYRLYKYGCILNGRYYPSVFNYIEFIVNNPDIMKKLSIDFTTDSHHDLIPANIVVNLGENSVSGIILIDPRGIKDTGSENRHYMYDIGKLLLGMDTLDIFRIFNGVTREKKYWFSKTITDIQCDTYSYNIIDNDKVVMNYQCAKEAVAEFFESDPKYKDDKMRFAFSHACMYHPDIPCRIIDEKNEEMATIMYLRGIMLLDDFINEFMYDEGKLNEFYSKPIDKAFEQRKVIGSRKG